LVPVTSLKHVVVYFQFVERASLVT